MTTTHATPAQLLLCFDAPPSDPPDWWNYISGLHLARMAVQDPQRFANYMRRVQPAYRRLRRRHARRFRATH
jgi:hypothetical protein